MKFVNFKLLGNEFEVADLNNEVHKLRLTLTSNQYNIK